jgi:hypothetical protein
MGGTQEALERASDEDDREHELSGEAMSVKSSLAGKCRGLDI